MIVIKNYKKGEWIKNQYKVYNESGNYMALINNEGVVLDNTLTQTQIRECLKRIKFLEKL